jgi:hypothetical protein
MRLSIISLMLVALIMFLAPLGCGQDECKSAPYGAAITLTLSPDEVNVNSPVAGQIVVTADNLPMNKIKVTVNSDQAGTNLFFFYSDGVTPASSPFEICTDVFGSYRFWISPQAVTTAEITAFSGAVEPASATLTVN